MDAMDYAMDHPPDHTTGPAVHCPHMPMTNSNNLPPPYAPVYGYGWAAPPAPGHGHNLHPFGYGHNNPHTPPHPVGTDQYPQNSSFGISPGHFAGPSHHQPTQFRDPYHANHPGYDTATALGMNYGREPSFVDHMNNPMPSDGRHNVTDSPTQHPSHHGAWRGSSSNLSPFSNSRPPANMSNDGSAAPNRRWRISNSHHRPHLPAGTPSPAMPSPPPSIPPFLSFGHAEPHASPNAYASDSYAGMMTSAVAPHQAFEANAGQLYSAMLREPAGSQTRLARQRDYEAYIASGEFQRNVTASYDRDTLTRPGQPLLDFEGHLANHGQGRNEENRVPSAGGGPSQMPRLTRRRVLDDRAVSHILNPTEGVRETDRVRAAEREQMEQLTMAARRAAEASQNHLRLARQRSLMRQAQHVASAPRIKRASRKFLKSLQEFEVEALPKDERACTICMESLGVPEPIQGKIEYPVRLPCGHVFGRACITIWLEEHCTCPSCRHQVEAEIAITAEAARSLTERGLATTQITADDERRFAVIHDESIRDFAFAAGLAGRSQLSALAEYARARDAAANYRASIASAERNPPRGRHSSSISGFSDGFEGYAGVDSAFAMGRSPQRRPTDDINTPPFNHAGHQRAPNPASGSSPDRRRSAAPTFSVQRPEIQEFSESSSSIGSRLSTMFRPAGNTIGRTSGEVNPSTAALAPGSPQRGRTPTSAAPRTQTSNSPPSGPAHATRSRRQRLRTSPSITNNAGDTEEEASAALRMDG